MLNVVLYAPRIPQNAGQVARACHAMGCRLHLVRPLGFRIDAAALKRAAVGYLADVDYAVHADGDALWNAIGPDRQPWLVTKFGRQPYTRVDYCDGDWLIFGSETEGLPRPWLELHADRTVAIPMLNPQVRCLNLATSVAVVMFEALRQIGLPHEG